MPYKMIAAFCFQSHKTQLRLSFDTVSFINLIKHELLSDSERCPWCWDLKFAPAFLPNHRFNPVQMRTK